MPKAISTAEATVYLEVAQPLHKEAVRAEIISNFCEP